MNTKAEAEIGDQFADLHKGPARGINRDRVVEVIGIVSGGGLVDRTVLLQNVSTNRRTAMKESRLLDSSRFSFIGKLSTTEAKTEPSLSEATSPA